MEPDIKKEFIYSTSNDIVEFINNKYCVEVDIHDVAQLINEGLGFMFDLTENLIEDIQDE